MNYTLEEVRNELESLCMRLHPSAPAYDPVLSKHHTLSGVFSRQECERIIDAAEEYTEEEEHTWRESDTHSAVAYVEALDILSISYTLQAKIFDTVIAELIAVRAQDHHHHHYIRDCVECH